VSSRPPTPGKATLWKCATGKPPLAQLPREQLAVLLLIALEDYSYAETARLLGIPLGTVMSRLARARENPRAILAEDARPARLRIVT